MSAMTHTYVLHDSFICVTGDRTHLERVTDPYIWVPWLIHVWKMTHSYVWHDSFIFVTWLIHTCDMTMSYLGHELSLGTGLFVARFTGDLTHLYIWDMTHLYMGHDSSACVLHFEVTWLIHKWVSLATGSFHRWHDSSVYETWLIHVCVTFCSDMTHS